MRNVFEATRALAAGAALIVLTAGFGAGCKRSAPEPLEEPRPVAEKTMTMKEPERKREVQEPVVAGAFYPSDPAELSRMIQSHLAAVKAPELDGMRPFGFMVPHAGYPFSGPVAAYVYKAIAKSEVKKFVIIGPAHRVNFPGVFVMDKDAYRTPLGEVKLARGLAQKLAGSRNYFSTDDRLYGREHSVEVQLPFLQTVAGPDISVVVVVIGRLSPEMTEDLARALEETFAGEEVIYLASSDMSHGNYPPYKGTEQTRPVDLRTLELIKSLDIAGLKRGLVDDSAPLCGGLPVLTLMHLFKLRGGSEVRTLHYADSGDATGDHSRVVGYGASAFLLPGGESGPTESGIESKGAGMNLSDQEKLELLKMARAVVEAAVKKERVPSFETSLASLRAPGAAFVTLKTQGELRGCIGSIIATEPLYQCVQRRAADAALNDARFVHHRLQPSELSEVEVEISVLTPPRRVSSPDEVVVGRDGVILELAGHGGVFLPHVPLEQGWDREQYLSNLCRKAGLSDPKCYRHPRAALKTFQAIVFSEHDFPKEE